MIIPMNQMAAETENRRLLFQQSFLNFAFSLSMFVLGIVILVKAQTNNATEYIDSVWQLLSFAEKGYYQGGQGDLTKLYSTNMNIVGGITFVFSLLLFIIGVCTTIMSFRIANIEVGRKQDITEKRTAQPQ
jgi:hypothetical protein